jgi:hypothetical protein
VTVGYMPSWDTSVFDPERRRSSLPAGDGNGRRALPVSRKLPPRLPKKEEGSFLRSARVSDGSKVDGGRQMDHIRKGNDVRDGDSS